MINDRSSFEGWTLGGSQCQTDGRKLLHTVIPLGCILAGLCPAEQRHRETRAAAGGEGGGEFRLTHSPLPPFHPRHAHIGLGRGTSTPFPQCEQTNANTS